MNIIKKVLSNPLVWATVIYLLLPVDLVPDVTPVLGTADDLVFFLVTLILQEASNSNNNNNNQIHPGGY